MFYVNNYVDHRKNIRLPSHAPYPTRNIPLNVEHCKLHEYVEIPGLSNIFHRNHSFRSRFFWAVILVGFMTLCLLQIGCRLNTFFNQEPRVNSREQVNSSLKFPAISFCPYYFRRNPTIKNLAGTRKESEAVPIEVLKNLLKNLTVEQLWNMAVDYIPQWTVHVLHRQSMIDDPMDLREESEPNVNISYIMSLTGKCPIYTFDDNLIVHHHESAMLLMSLPNFQLSDSSAIFSFYFYPKEEEYLGQFFTTYQGFNSFVNFLILFKVKIHEIRYVNRTSHPCDSPEAVAKCKENCLVDYLYRRTQEHFDCRLPYLRNVNNTPLCTDENIIVEIMRCQDLAFKEFHFAHCHCPRKCVDTIYTTVLSDTFPNPINVTYIDVRFDNTVVIMEEYWPLTLDALLSDIGGSLGLYLGVCIVTVVELFQFFAWKIKKAFLDWWMKWKECKNYKQVMDFKTEIRRQTKFGNLLLKSPSRSGVHPRTSHPWKR